jgi:hypothetical protein
MRIWYYTFALMFGAGFFFPADIKAFPPAPHHTFLGMVRDELGRPLEGEKVKVLFETSSGRMVQTAVAPGSTPGFNYKLKVPMDSGSTDDLYHPVAMRYTMPFKIRVQVGLKVYLPIEMIGDLSSIGQPGKNTLLNLTLGVDSDGDGLPDAWERALLGNGKGIGDINPEDDTDGDGMSNLDEYISGNYAFDKNDGLRLDILEKREEGSTLEFTAITGRTYTIHASDNLKKWTKKKFKLQDQEAAILSYRATDVRKLRVNVVNAGDGAVAKFYKLMVQ